MIGVIFLLLGLGVLISGYLIGSYEEEIYHLENGN